MANDGIECRVYVGMALIKHINGTTGILLIISGRFGNKVDGEIKSVNKCA